MFEQAKADCVPIHHDRARKDTWIPNKLNDLNLNN